MDPDLTCVALWLDSSSVCVFCNNACTSSLCRGNHVIRAGGTTHPNDQRWASNALQTLARHSAHTPKRGSDAGTTAAARLQPPTCIFRAASLLLCASSWRSRAAIFSLRSATFRSGTRLCSTMSAVGRLPHTTRMPPEHTTRKTSVGHPVPSMRPHRN